MEEKNKQLKWGITISLSLISVILVFLGLTHLKTIYKVVCTVLKAIEPIIIGCVLAYLVAPVQRRLSHFLTKRHLNKKASETISIFTILIAIILIIVVSLKLIVPQLLQTSIELSISLPKMLRQWMRSVEQFGQSQSQIYYYANQLVDKFIDWFNSWVQTRLTDTLQAVLNSLVNVVTFGVHVIIGIIVMVYVLFEKEHLRGLAKKMLYSVSKNRDVNAFLLDTVRECDRVFGGFITGKIIDSVIIGVICLIGMVAMQMPYGSLIALIVGVTNIIPFFGPYFGAVPSAALIFLVSPVKAVEFIIFILILQQVDGNIIGPRILGDSTGLSPFWVLFSILLFGNLFGVLGMIIGVPTFATIYYVVKRLVEAGLLKQGLPAETERYTNVAQIDDHNMATFVRTEPQKKKKIKVIKPKKPGNKDTE